MLFQTYSEVEQSKTNLPITVSDAKVFMVVMMKFNKLFSSKNYLYEPIQCIGNPYQFLKAQMVDYVWDSFKDGFKLGPNKQRDCNTTLFVLWA